MLESARKAQSQTITTQSSDLVERSHSNHQYHAPLRLVVLAPRSHLLVHQHLQHLNVEELHHLVYYLHHLPPLDDRRGGQHSFREEHIPWSSSRTIRGAAAYISLLCTC